MSLLYGLAAPQPALLIGATVGDLTGTSFHVGRVMTKALSWEEIAATTMVVGKARPQENATADQARALRATIEQRSRLTRQEIAALVGVDRRSLSAWCSGQTTPAAANLQRLRRLDALVSSLVAAGAIDPAGAARDPDVAAEVAAAIADGDLSRGLRAITAGDTGAAPTAPLTVTMTPEEWSLVSAMLRGAQTHVPRSDAETAVDLPDANVPTPPRVAIDPSEYRGGSTMRRRRPYRA